MIWSTSAIILLSALPVPAPVQSPVPRPAQIILIRHAEKPDDPANPHLSPAGVARASQLVSFITTDEAMNRFGPPVAIFATRTTRDGDGQRTQETVAPLARALKLPVQTPYHGKDFAALAKLILTSPAYSGKTVLICWNHAEIPQLAAALGVAPMPRKWKKQVFDRVYVISYRDDRPRLTVGRYGGR